MKKTFLALALIGTSTSIYASPYIPKTEVKTYPILAHSRYPVNVYVDAYNEITNNSDKPIRIWARYNMYISACGNDPHHWIITVKPHTTWKDHWRPTKECNFKYGGNYQITGEAIIDGIDIDLHAQSIEYGMVSVT
jgi:hypothetical protein